MADDEQVQISPELDLAIDLAIEYGVSTLAGGERLQPFASYEDGGATTRAFFLGAGNPDPVEEGREWVRDLRQLQYVALTFPGELVYAGDRRQKAIMVEAWEPGMTEGLVVAQPYRVNEMADLDAGEPKVVVDGGQLEVGRCPAPRRTPE